MKINVAISVENNTKFCDLNIGEVFEYGGSIYLKTYSDVSFRLYDICKNEATYDNEDFDDNDSVRPLNSELKIWE